MARLWSSGFETGSDTNGIEWINHSGAAATTQNTVARSGTYAGKIASLSSTTKAGWLWQYKTGTSTRLFWRFYFRVDTLPSAENTIAVFGTGTATIAGFNPDYWVTLGSDGKLRLYDSNRAGAQITGGTALSTATWYRIEVDFIDPDLGTGQQGFHLYLDGTQEGSYYNTGISTNPIHFLVGGNLKSEAQTTGVWYFDDVAVNDSSGSVQNSLPGAGSIVHLWPDGAGDFAEGDSGPTGSQTAYQMVDEVTPNDATDYWLLKTDSSANSTSADRLDVTVSAPPSASAVTLVQVFGRVSTLTAASASWVPRIKSQASGTIVEGTTTTIAVTTWGTNDDTATTRNPKLTSYTDPQNASNPWTETLLGTMQIGARAPDGNPDVLISTLWALVEYTPGAGGPTYTLACAQGSYSQSGQAAGLLDNRKLGLAQGSYSQTGQSVTLNRPRSVAAAQGTYALSGQAAALAKGNRVPLAQGAYSLTGQAAALAKGSRVPLAQGAYLLTGQAAALVKGNLLPLAQGAYSLAGQAVTLTRPRSLTAAQGAYSLAGQAAALLAARRVAVSQGAYALAGQASAFLFHRLLALLQGSYALAGQSVALSRPRSLTAAQGAYTLTGEDVALRAGAGVTLATGTFSLTGQAVAFLAGRRLPGSQGAYVLTGEDVTMFSGRPPLAAQAGSYAAAGQAVNLLRNGNLPAAAGSYVVAGQIVRLLHQFLAGAAQGSYVVTGNVVTLQDGRRLAVATGIYLLVGEDVLFVSGGTTAGGFGLVGSGLAGVSPLIGRGLVS